jgi:hypothetical protein
MFEELSGGMEASSGAWASLLGHNNKYHDFLNLFFKLKILQICCQENLDLDRMDRIRTRHSLGSGYGFSEMPGSVSGLIESGAETLYVRNNGVECNTKKQAEPAGEKRLKQC